MASSKVMEFNSELNKLNGKSDPPIPDAGCHAFAAFGDGMPLPELTGPRKHAVGDCMLSRPGMSRTAGRIAGGPRKHGTRGLYRAIRGLLRV